MGSEMCIRDRPRCVPFRQNSGRPAFFYADAFFELGDKRYRPSDSDIPEQWNNQKTANMHNGWGAIIFTQPDACGNRFRFCIKGEVPAKVLARFCTRRAFIYFLETWAQVVTFLGFDHMLGAEYLSFVDNEAAKHALIKGYGKDSAINSVIGIYWGAHADSQQTPWLERVTSKSNVSDEISRNVYDMANALQCTEIPLDLTEVYNIILQAADDMMFAHEQAHKLLIAVLREQVDSFISTSSVQRLPDCAAIGPDMPLR